MDINNRQSSEAAELNPEVSIDDKEPRTRHHSQKQYTRSTDNSRKLGFYPLQWCDVLESAQQLWWPWMAF